MRSTKQTNANKQTIIMAWGKKWGGSLLHYVAPRSDQPRGAQWPGNSTNVSRCGARSGVGIEEKERERESHRKERKYEVEGKEKNM